MSELSIVEAKKKPCALRTNICTVVGIEDENSLQ